MENRKRREEVVAALCCGGVWSEEDAKVVLDGMEASGESVTTFARRHGLVPQRLWYWKKRLANGLRRGHAGAVPNAPVATLIPVTVRHATPETNPAAVNVGGGIRVELRTLDASSAAWVASLVKALGEAS